MQNGMDEKDAILQKLQSRGWTVVDPGGFRNVPEGRCDRSLARSAWGKRPSKEPSRRVRYDRAQLIPEVFLVQMCAVFLKEGFRIRNFATPIIESVRTPARITPFPTGRLFGVALFQALRARLRSRRPSGTFRNRP